MAFAIMRIAKLKGGAVSASDDHTDRTRETLNADKHKTAHNIYLIGKKGDLVKKLVDAEISRAGGKPRKDSVECIEFLMTASHQYFEPQSADENGIAKSVKELAAEQARLTADFMQKGTLFIELMENRGLKFVKAAVHLDETTPHIAAYAIPFDANGKLNAKFHFGGKQKLSKLQDDYAEIMAPLGLERGVKGSSTKHERIKSYYGRVEQIYEAVSQLDAAQQQANEATNVLRMSNEMLKCEREKRQDIPLAKIAQTAFQATVITSHGLAILNTKQNTIVAVITDTNQAFNVAGDLISNGSSIQMLTALTEMSPLEARTFIETKFGSTKAEAAAAKYGIETTNFAQLNTSRNRPEWNQSFLSQEIKEQLSARAQTAFASEKTDSPSSSVTKENHSSELADDSTITSVFIAKASKDQVDPEAKIELEIGER